MLFTCAVHLTTPSSSVISSGMLPQHDPSTGVPLDKASKFVRPNAFFFVLGVCVVDRIYIYCYIVDDFTVLFCFVLFTSAKSVGMRKALALANACWC